MEEIARACAAIDESELRLWLSAADKLHCHTLNAIAIPTHHLQDATRELRDLAAQKSPKLAAWESLVAMGVSVDAFLGLVLALAAKDEPLLLMHTAALYLAAARCDGAVSHGLLHPMVCHELVARLRASLGTVSGRSSKPTSKRATADKPDVALSAGFKAARSAVLTELASLLEHVPLRSHPEVLSQFVSLLVSMVPSCATTADDEGPLGALAHCLHARHGDASHTTPIVFRSLVPPLSLNIEGGPSTKEAAAAQLACADFIATVCHSADASTNDGRALLHAAQAAMQHASAAAPERAEPRAAVCASLARLLRCLPPVCTSRYASFLWSYSRNAKVAARVFATDMAAAMLGSAVHSAALRLPEVVGVLWRLVTHRLDDRVALVRGRALTALAAVITAGPSLLGLAQEPVPVAADAASAGVARPAASPQRLPTTPGSRGTSATGRRAAPTTPLHIVASPSASLTAAAEQEAPLEAAVAKALERCGDERPAVRKAALQAVEAWAKLDDGASPSLESSELASVCVRCTDKSSLVRKQAARTLSALYGAAPHLTDLRGAWIDSVLPLVRDSEASVADAALEAVDAFALTPLADCGSDPDAALGEPLWLLLQQMGASSQPHIEAAVASLERQGKLPRLLGKSAQQLLGLEGLSPQGRASLWSILHGVAVLPKATSSRIDLVTLVWSVRNAPQASPDEAMALRTLLGLATRGGVPKARCTELRDELVARLRAPSGTGSSAATSACANVCIALDTLVGAGPGAWVAELRDAATSVICRAASHPSSAQASLLERALVITGELALVAGAPAMEEIVVAAASELLMRVHWGDESAGALAAVSIIMLGKASLGSLALAQRLIPVFLRELGSSSSAAVRSNAMVVIHDLIKQNAALLDRHIPTIALALADPEPLVRHTSLLVLSQLLLEDYVKWRHCLFRGFARLLADDVAHVRNAAQVCLIDTLLPRAPSLALSSFISLLFELNGCLEHPQYSAPLPAAELAASDVSGAENQPKRLRVLRALLSHMPDEQRLQATSKLCHEVLASLLDGHLTLAKSHWVIADALKLLACKEAKISTAAGGGSANVDEADSEEPTASSAAAAAKGKLLSLVARKATVEAIVPVVIELKRTLEKSHSPLLRDVFLFLRELLRDHKPHIEDIFLRDKQLAAEIEYDLRSLPSRSSPDSALVVRKPPAKRRSSTLVPASTPPPDAATGEAAQPSANKVPTPDRAAFSALKLRSGRRSSVGADVAALGTENHRPAPLDQEVATGSADVVMASPFKEPPKARPWNVSAEGSMVLFPAE